MQTDAGAPNLNIALTHINTGEKQLRTKQCNEWQAVDWPFHGGNTGSNPVGDANFDGFLEVYGLSGLKPSLKKI